MIDGVDVGDPEGGTIWVFANHNWIQEVQVIGLGANAEYGGFTGVASNSLFRSGSNKFRGLFETLYENDSLTDSNTTEEILEENPVLTSGTTDYVTDTHVPDRRPDQDATSCGSSRASSTTVRRPRPRAIRRRRREGYTGPGHRAAAAPREVAALSVQADHEARRRATS